MDMYASQLGAAVKCRKDLTRIEQKFGVESTFQTLLLLKVGFAEHFGHQVPLFYADPMFAGEDPAHFDAQLQNVVTEGLGAFQLVEFVRIIQDKRVKVAGPGVAKVRKDNI